MVTTLHAIPGPPRHTNDTCETKDHQRSWCFCRCHIGTHTNPACTTPTTPFANPRPQHTQAWGADCMCACHLMLNQFDWEFHNPQNKLECPECHVVDPQWSGDRTCYHYRTITINADMTFTEPEQDIEGHERGEEPEYWTCQACGFEMDYRMFRALRREITV